MIAIRSFIEQIIYISIVAIIIELILPKGNTKKYVYVILSLFVLLNIISPIINVINDLDMQNVVNSVLEAASTNVETSNSISIDEFSEYKNVQIKNSVEEELSKQIKNKLSEASVEFKDLRVTLNDDYTIKSLKISIGNLDNLGDKKVDKISRIISEVSKEYSIDEEVITIVEEGVE